MSFDLFEIFVTPLHIRSSSVFLLLFFMVFFFSLDEPQYKLHVATFTLNCFYGCEHDNLLLSAVFSQDSKTVVVQLIIFNYICKKNCSLL
jgi:hypothetical protein